MAKLNSIENWFVSWFCSPRVRVRRYNSYGMENFQGNAVFDNKTSYRNGMNLNQLF